MAAIELAQNTGPVSRQERNFNVFQVITEEQTELLREAKTVYGVWRARMNVVTDLLSRVDREPTEWEKLTAVRYEESLAHLTKLITDPPTKSFVSAFGGYVKFPIPNRVARYFQ